MRRLIIFLLFLVVSVWFGLTVLRHPGYLLVVYQPWMVQMPLWFGLLALFIVFGVFYILVDSIDQISFLWYRIKNWFRLRREHKFYSKTQQGLTNLIEARWKKAEKLLLAGANKSAEPFINYLAAAKAANELGASDRAESYLQQASRIAPDAAVAIGLSQAEMQLKRDEYEKAKQTLERLYQLAPRHPRVLKLLEKVYVKLGEWEPLRTILPSMRKAKIITADQWLQFEKNIYCEILKASQSHDLQALHQLWASFPRAMRKNPDVVCAYVKRLKSFGTANDEMEELICKTIKYDWQPELIHIYAGLSFNNLNRQLVIGNAWLKLYGDKPELLLMLGKFCMQIQLWGKAKDYFERCLALGPNDTASLNYGNLLTQLGKTEEAMQAYKGALADSVAY